MLQDSSKEIEKIIILGYSDSLYPRKLYDWLHMLSTQCLENRFLKRKLLDHPQLGAYNTFHNSLLGVPYYFCRIYVQQVQSAW